MDNRLLGISLSTIAIALRGVADNLTLMANQLNPPNPDVQIWDRKNHKIADARLPVTLVEDKHRYGEAVPAHPKEMPFRD